MRKEPYTVLTNVIIICSQRQSHNMNLFVFAGSLQAFEGDCIFKQLTLNFIYVSEISLCFSVAAFVLGLRRSNHNTLTSTDCSAKLTTKTKHVPALFAARQVDSTKISNTKIGPFFGPGLHLDQARSQAKNTSKNDDLKFLYLIFAWELLLNTYRGPGCAQFE